MKVMKVDHESCIFYKKDESGKLLIVVGVHVDDNMIVGVKWAVKEFADTLDEELGTKNLGDPSVHLGIECHVDSDGNVGISQGRMIRDILKEFNITDTDMPVVPMKADTEFNVPHDVSKAQKEYNIRRLIGVLIYIMRGSFPVLAIYISLLSSTLHCPMKKWHDLAIGVLSWLQRYQDGGIRFVPNMKKPILEIRVDAELAGQSKEGKKLKSRGGYLIYMRGMLIGWYSGKHSITSTSTFDSEIRALYKSVEKAWVIRKTLVELGFFFYEFLGCCILMIPLPIPAVVRI